MDAYLDYYRIVIGLISGFYKDGLFGKYRKITK